MLPFMRKFVRSPYAAVLFFLLIVSFGIFGFHDPFSGVIGGGFVQIGNREVRPADVSLAVDRQLEDIRVQQNKVLSTREAAQQGITQQALQTLITRTSVLAFADKIGVRASPDAVNNFLLNQPGVRDAVGRVDIQALQRVASQEKKTVKQFEDSVADDLTLAYVANAALQNVAPPEVLSRPLVTYFGEKRTISAARLTPASVTAPKTPTDEELKTYYDQNKTQFDQPERRRISVLTFSPADFADQVPVTDADVEKYYQNHIKEYSTPETRDIAQFTAKDRKTLQDFVDVVKQGNTIEQAAAKVPGVDRSNVTVKPGDLKNKDYDKLVFMLKTDTLEGPYQVDNAYYAVQVLKIAAGTPTPLAEAKDKIHEKLANEGADAKYGQTYEQIRDLAGGSPLEEIGKQIGAPVIHLAPVDNNAVNIGRQQSTLLAAHPEVVRQLFTMTAGQMTDIIEGDNERSLYRLDEIVPKYTLSFEDAKAQVRVRYMLKQAQEAADKVANDMIAAVKGGKPFDQAAASLKMAAIGSIEMIRADNSQIDPGVKDAAYALKEGEVGLARAQSGEPWVIKVDKVTPANEQVDPQLKQQITDQVSRTLNQDFEEVFVRGVMTEVPVHQNDSAIQNYFDRLLKDDQAQ